MPRSKDTARIFLFSGGVMLRVAQSIKWRQACDALRTCKNVHFQQVMRIRTCDGGQPVAPDSGDDTGS
ncbi:hypothetical protein B2G71_08415 [Novosphingobium sp. PC22D]|nr:hypothetical protein B2G71_08415 [Novosphingobium sp. PC22D]